MDVNIDDFGNFGIILQFQLLKDLLHLTTW